MKIVDIIGSKNAVTHAFGVKVFDAISKHFANGEKVFLSFQGVKNVTSGFANGSIGKIYSEFKEASELLTIGGLEGKTVWIEKIENAKQLGSNPQIAKVQNNAIYELLQS
ncbi:MAG TPA: STAS-like domain-containing protein [Williamwhitmania sp.]|nr:STAS-like domain-containing protein [Williamwhitmania sp.]